jgi:hypothetical protein
MASLPHTPAVREPLTTLVAELFGAQPTPAPQAATDRSTADERWQDAVTQVGEQLRAKLRVEALPERLHKALALVLAHAVTLHPDGTASVQSGTQTYRLAPECPCADATHRAELCQHSLAVELHRRTLALLDSTAPANSTTSSAGAVPAGAVPRTSAEAPPAATPPAREDTRQERLSSADRWDVTEAPASCCLRLRVGEIELMYTMRDVSDAELTSRVQHLVPWVQDVLDQARERQTLLDTLRQQREAAHTAPSASAPPTPQAPSAPADLQALLQQAVQQALDAHAPSDRTPPATGQAPNTPPPAPPSNGTAAQGAAPASQDGWCALHRVAMELRSNAKGAWHSHWLAAEARWCRGT